METKTILVTSANGVGRAMRDAQGQWETEVSLENQDVRSLDGDPLDRGVVYAGTQKTVAPEIFPELTNREREILQLISRGESNAAIAEKLSISLKTVRNHVSNIYNKLQVADRVQAIIRAREAGLS